MSTLDPHAHMALVDELDTAADFIGTTASHLESEIMRQFAAHLRDRATRIRELEAGIIASMASDMTGRALSAQRHLIRMLTGPLADVRAAPVPKTRGEP